MTLSKTIGLRKLRHSTPQTNCILGRMVQHKSDQNKLVKIDVLLALYGFVPKDIVGLAKQ